MDDLGGLDLVQAQQTCDLLGGGYLALVDTWHSDATSRLAAIQAHLDGDRLDELRLCAHALKGAALTMGAQRLASAAALLETSGTVTQADVDPLSLLLAQAQAALLALVPRPA